MKLWLIEEKEEKIGSDHRMKAVVVAEHSTNAFACASFGTTGTDAQERFRITELGEVDIVEGLVLEVDEERIYQQGVSDGYDQGSDDGE